MPRHFHTLKFEPVLIDERPGEFALLGTGVPLRTAAYAWTSV